MGRLQISLLCAAAATLFLSVALSFALQHIARLQRDLDAWAAHVSTSIEHAPNMRAEIVMEFGPRNEIEMHNVRWRKRTHDE